MASGSGLDAEGSILNRIPYGWVLLTPFLFLLLLSGTIVGVLSFRAGSVSVERMIDDLQERIEAEVAESLDNYLEGSLRLAQSNRIEIERGIVDPYDQDESDRFFSSRLEIWPAAAMSFFGDPNGEFYGARRTTDGDIQVVRNNASTGGASRYYSIDETGHAVELAAEYPNFDCRTRPWYIAAVETGDIVFSSVYKHFVFDDLAITASLPVYRPDGSLLGVLGVDYLLGRVNTFFDEVVQEEGIVLFAMEEESHYLVANSEGAPNFATAGDGSFTRIMPEESENELLGSLCRLTDDRPKEATIRWEGLVVSQFLFEKENLCWRLVLSIPERLFLSEIRQVGRTTIAILALTIVLAAILGFYLTRIVTVPVRRLVGFAERLAHQQWDTDVAIPGTNEIARLARSFNRMAGDLQSLVENLEEKVAERTAKLEESNRTKDRFFAIIAHDLRGPLTTATMTVEHILTYFDELDGDELRSVIEAISHSQKSVQQLLENLLVWARSQRGEIAYAPKDVALESIIGDALSTVESRASEKGVRIEHNVDDIVVRCDRDMIATVFRNLITNAIKYSHQDQTITVRARPWSGPETKDSTDNPAVDIEIIDEGVGIEPDTLATLTQIVGNRSQPGTKGEVGTGLGLVICNEFLAHHDTKLSVSSEVGRGSTFRFTLPIGKSEAISKIGSF